MARSDHLIDELFAADVVVMAVPMHNFGPPSTLKAWFDHIARAGRTFAYSDKGREGLLKGKKAIVVLARGGVYSDGPAKALDFQEPYVRSMLDFIGITDVHVVRVEGVAMGEDAVKRAIASAKEQADTVTRALA
jgi:FMN-dependent NADH-azoreductase